MEKIDKCLNCQHSDFKLLFPSRDRLLGLDGSFKVNRCKNCQLWFLNPRPDYDFLQKYYSASYIPYQKKEDDWRDKLEFIIYRILTGKKRDKFPFSLLKLIVRRGMVVKPGGNILDIGCGSGNYLKIAKKMGMNCYGTDIYSGAKNIFENDGIKFYNKKVEDIKFDENFFDVITLNHVLEHLADPIMVLKKINKFLKPEGVLIVHVPTSNSFNIKVFRRFCQSVDSPRHLYLYNPTNIKEIAKQAQFKIEKIEYRVPMTYNTTIYSIIYLLEAIFNKSKPAEKLRKIIYNPLTQVLLFPFAVLLNYLKIGDGMEVYFKKQDNNEN